MQDWQLSEAKVRCRMPSLIIQGVPTQILLIFSSKQKYLQLFSVSPFRKGKKLIQLGTKNWSNSQNNWNYLQCIFLPTSFSVAPCWFTEKKKKVRGIFSHTRKNRQGRKNFFLAWAEKRFAYTVEGIKISHWREF